ncbi:MAG: amidohydrolase family protein [Desulfobacteraceae bacterium]|jgi:predicted TIM-barrel fold metal-dependent hydrolase
MIVDAHVHIFPRVFRENREDLFDGEPAFELLYRPSNARLAGCEALVQDMDRHGVDRAVVFGFPWERKDTYQRHNDYILEAVTRYPDRLVGLGCFSLSAKGCAREAERCLEAGLAGVGELAVYDAGFSASALPELNEVMSACAERNAPLLLHTNEPVGHVYPGKTAMALGELYAFLKAYPQNRLILAHWGGGLFFYRLMKKEVQDVLKNVWFDTAASPFLYRPDIYRIAMDIVGYERILFGSDYPLIQPDRYFRELEQAGLPAEAVRGITGENAESVFGLSG